jgi:hypothetical protein
MAHGREACERAVEHVTRGTSVHVRDEADAARIALSSWVVEDPLPVAGDGEHLSFGGSKSPAGFCIELVRRRREVGAD